MDLIKNNLNNCFEAREKISFIFFALFMTSSLSCLAQDSDQKTKLNLNLNLPELQSNVVNHCMRFDKQNRVLTKMEFKKEETRVVRDFYFDAVDNKIKAAINNMPKPQKVIYANKLLKVYFDVIIADTGDLCSVRIIESNSDDYSKWLVDTINKAAPFAPFPAEMASESSLIRAFNWVEYDATRRIRYY